MTLKNRYTVCWMAVLTWSALAAKGGAAQCAPPPVPPPPLWAVLRRPVRRPPLRVLPRLSLRLRRSIAPKSGR